MNTSKSKMPKNDSKFIVHLTQNFQDTLGLALILTHPLNFGVEIHFFIQEAFKFIKKNHVYGVIIDYPSYQTETFAHIEAIQKNFPNLPIIAVTGSKGIKKITSQLKNMGIHSIIQRQIIEIDRIRQVILGAIKIPLELQEAIE